MEKGVWQRVAPTLNPWPGADAVGKALRDGAKADGVTLASDAVRTPHAVSAPETVSLGPVEPDAVSLPGAEPDPCCMGTEAETDLAVVAGFVEDEQSERRQLQVLARQAPVWARQTVLSLSARAAGRARRLIAAYYLITGETYLPAVRTERIYTGKWCPALRERYHNAACTAMNYERAADGTPDPCLGALFRELSADAFECAEAVSRILERSLVG
ncbi:MAG: ferritin-like domain-containing protein [Oscillibacter sp.]|nr:ferritin-like domain-containing protein [Oscillibacter sp.]